MADLEILSEERVAFYRSEGYLVLEKCIPDNIITALRAEIARFEEEARGLTESNERLDLEDSHTPEIPRVRRIKVPHTTSEVVKSLLHSDHILAPVRDLIGPDVRLHGSKLNMKSAGYGAAVEWHQDFAFYPHTNADVLAVGVIIDDMESENGPLHVFPGSHKGPVYDHHMDGVFAGAMDLAACGFDITDAAELTGPAGSISIHHGHVVHGSALNRSNRSRRILFLEMTAADAFPIAGGTTKFESIEEFNSRILCGEPTFEPRVENVSVRIPQPQPEMNRSIYEIQEGLKNRAFEKAS